MTSATRSEARRSPWWAVPVIGIATVWYGTVWNVLVDDASTAVALVMSAGWVAFVLAWTVAIRHKNRARSGSTAMDRSHQREGLLVTLIGVVVFAAGAAVSDALAGAAVGILGVAYASYCAWRARRS